MLIWYQASDKGEAIAGTSLTAFIFILLIFFTYFSYKYTSKKQNERLEKSKGSLNSALLENNNETNDHDVPRTTRKLRENQCLFQSPTISIYTIIFFWCLMLAHTTLIMIGLIGYWDQ